MPGYNQFSLVLTGSHHNLITDHWLLITWPSGRNCNCNPWLLPGGEEMSPSSEGGSSIYGYLHLSTVIYTSHPARHWPPLRAASNLAEKRLQALKGAECRPMAAKKFPELSSPHRSR